MKGNILILLFMLLSLLLIGCNSKGVETKDAQNDLNKEIKEISAEEHNKKIMQDSLKIELEGILQEYPNTSENRYSYSVEFPMVIKNLTNDTIKGFIADTKFTNMFGDTLLELQIRYDQDLISQNGSIEWVGAYDLNQFNDDDMRFFNTPSNNINFEYEIIEIHFLSGKTYR